MSGSFLVTGLIQLRELFFKYSVDALYSPLTFPHGRVFGDSWCLIRGLSTQKSKSRYTSPLRGLRCSALTRALESD